MKYVWIMILAGSLGGCGATPKPQVGYRQEVARDAARVGLGFFSHAEPGARRDYSHCDNFTLTESLELTHVRWWGYMDGTAGEDLANVTGFVVEVHDGHGDTSSTGVAFQAEFTLADTTPMATGRRGSGLNEASTALEYMHEVSIEPPLALEAGVEYHIQVAARLAEPSLDNWQWADSETVDTITFSYSYRRQTWLRTEDTDSAFELWGRSR